MPNASLWTCSKVTLLTGVVLLAFFYSSLGWRHLDSSQSMRIAAAAVILTSMYVLMVFELVNRNLAALIGAAVSVATYDCLVERVSMEQILEWEDLETLALLFGMMIIVNVLALSGLFDYLAIWTYQRTAGNFWWLLTIMSIITAVLSAFIDNVSTMLLVSPTLIKLAELEDLDPRPVLIIMVLFCNIGGCATPVGDPPNLIIIGDPVSSELGIGFGVFVAYCAPCVLITIVSVLVYLKLRYKSKESFVSETMTGDCQSVTNSVQAMELAIDLEGLNAAESGAKNNSAFSSSSVAAASGPITTVNAIKNKTILILSLVVLVATVALFFLQSLPGTNLTLGWISLFSGLTLLVLCSGVKAKPAKDADTLEGHDEEEEEKDIFELAINNIEWSTLIFFFSLFIVMEVMQKLGFIGFVGQQISTLIDQLPAGHGRHIGALTIILWCSGLASACIDNVPFTSMMIKVLATMLETVNAEHKFLETNMPTATSLADHLNVKSLVIALAFGACYGGNGTIIGASANLVTAGVAGRNGYPINFNSFLRYAAVPTLISLVVANIYLVVVFVFLGL